MYVCMCVYIYIYIHIYNIHMYNGVNHIMTITWSLWRTGLGSEFERLDQHVIGWHYVSNAPCLKRPLLFYVFCLVSRIDCLNLDSEVHK